MRRQPIGAVEKDPFQEVRTGLAFRDLVTGSDADPFVLKRLTAVLPKVGALSADVKGEKPPLTRASPTSSAKPAQQPSPPTVRSCSINYAKCPNAAAYPAAGDGSLLLGAAHY